MQSLYSDSPIYCAEEQGFQVYLPSAELSVKKVRINRFFIKTMFDRFGEYRPEGGYESNGQHNEASRTIDPQNLFHTYASGFSGGSKFLFLTKIIA